MPVTQDDLDRYNRLKAMHEDKNGNPNEKRIAYEKMQKMIQDNPQLKDALKNDELKSKQTSQTNQYSNTQNPNQDRRESDIYKDVNKMAEQQINDFIRNVFSQQPKPNPNVNRKTEVKPDNKGGSVFNTVFGMFSNLRKIVSPFDKQKREIKNHLTFSTTPGQRVSTVTIKIPTALLVKIIENNEGKEFEAIRNYSGAIFELAKESFEDDWIKALEVMEE